MLGDTGRDLEPDEQVGWSETKEPCTNPVAPAVVIVTLVARLDPTITTGDAPEMSLATSVIAR